MLQVFPDYEGNLLDLPQFTAKSGREVASYQYVEVWILSHVPLHSFSKYHGGGTSNHVECFNSCMSRGGNKNVNRSSGHSQATTFWGVLNKKMHGDSWEQKAEVQARAGCPITADARKLYKRMDAKAKRGSAYCKAQEAKASRAQGKKGPNSVAAAQVSRKAFNALGEHAAERGRSALKDTSQARLHLHGLRQELKAVTDELESGYRALSASTHVRGNRPVRCNVRHVLLHLGIGNESPERRSSQSCSATHSRRPLLLLAATAQAGHPGCKRRSAWCVYAPHLSLIHI